ncbi:MAG: SAV_2336 N-terminal domain-related protein [Microcystis sp.]|jgi:formylglycine-generating enzyme required for sulfatase activity|uniref:formylglycine-generating enzyme family protein n=1 Tax=Microcystis sp. TaxID=1127 RepID=UPI0022BE8ECF|nr:formylglycine-generating enzyme family protein [Microcystis sp. LE17-20D]MCZ8064460.1 formylglycine-generating enzyme family protein [Microcystis sp. LE17-20D]MCZ8273332.1 formylglycine-generating enzyme family protein [Microcystis sp. LE19-4.1E]
MSDASASVKPDQFKRLLKTLNQSELEMTSYELADLCWLLLHLPQIVETAENKTEGEIKDISSQSNSSSSAISVGNDVNKKNNEEAAGLFPRRSEQDSFVGGSGSLTFPVDNPSDLGSSLSLARALKTLLRRVPTQDRPSILDEVRTVESFAATDQKILNPVFKPTLEPWLELALVFDRSPSMDIWHQTLTDLKTVLQHYGIFRDVQVWQLAFKENNLFLYKGLSKTNSRVYHPKELLNPNGRRLIVVVSDCVASYWRDGRIFPLLKLWSQSSPLAILQMLPEWLWLKTGLGLGAKVTLFSDEPGLTNSRLKFRDVLIWENVFREQNRLPIPVFTLEPFSVERWSSVVVGRSDTKVAGFVLTPDTKEELEPEAELNLTPEEIVRRFRNNASLLAQELAELLAATPTIFLPVVRLIRKEMLPEAGQVQIAEVFLGGILRVRSLGIKETDPDAVLYDFINPEVRDILQLSSTRSTTVNVFDRVSKYIAKQLNLELRDFLAELKKPSTEIGGDIQGIIRPFAEVSARILRNLGGNYLVIAEQLEQTAARTPGSQTSQNTQSKKVPVSVNPVSVKTLQKLELLPFNFEVVRVNAKGEQIKKESKQSQYFREDLGNDITLEMVAIPGGTFLMGTEDEEIEKLVKKFGWDGFRRERPQHQVTVPPFFMGKYPVTQAQWIAIACRTYLKVELNLKLNPSRFRGDNRPVEEVNWYDAVEFCARLSKLTGREYRLPSEAEWEYACRAGTTTPFYFGETITGELANYRASGTYAGEPKGEDREQTTPVGQFPPNAFGLYDMHGNVWEWCADTWHDNYDGAPTDGSAWIENGDDNRSPLRGGSWFYDPLYCRSADRDYPYYYRRDYPYYSGFRVVCGAGRTL